MSLKSPLTLIRLGLAITFIWIGIRTLQNPESWAGMMQTWFENLLPIPAAQFMIGAGITDIAVGILFLLPWTIRIAGIIGSLHLIGVLIATGVNDVTVRDIGLLGTTLYFVLQNLKK